MPKSKKGPEDASPEKKSTSKKATVKKSTASARKSATKPVEEKVIAASGAAPEVSTPVAATKAPRHADVEQIIRIRAYELFLERNGKHGDPQQDWLRAEAEVHARQVA